jgi:hypothetical protein
MEDWRERGDTEMVSGVPQGRVWHLKTQSYWLGQDRGRLTGLRRNEVESWLHKISIMLSMPAPSVFRVPMAVVEQVGKILPLLHLQRFKDFLRHYQQSNLK